MRKIVSLFYQLAKVLLGSRAKRFGPVRVVHQLILSYLKTTYAVVDGHPMHLDRRDSLYLSINGAAYEPFETGLVKKEIKKNCTVLDLGANIGYYSLIFARLVGNGGTVFAFEPDESNAALLEKNIEINGYRNVRLVKKAVSNQTGKIRLYLSEDNLGDHRIYDSQDGRRYAEVEATTLDDYFQNYDRKIDFIKMDIQGAEGGALQGMSRILDTHKDIKMLTEFWPFGLQRFGLEPEEYLKLLSRNGFQLFEINELLCKLEPVEPTALLRNYTPANNHHTNLLCVRPTRIEVRESESG